MELLQFTRDGLLVLNGAFACVEVPLTSRGLRIHISDIVPSPPSLPVLTIAQYFTESGRLLNSKFI